MAITWIIQSDEKVGRHRIIRALLRDGTTVKQAEMNIARDASPTLAAAQAAWDAAPALPNGLDEWEALQLRETDALYDKVIRAILNKIRDGGGVADGGTLAAITDAGKAVLASSSTQTQTQALSRLTNLFKAASPVQQADFLMLMVLVTNSKLGQR